MKHYKILLEKGVRIKVFYPKRFAKKNFNRVKLWEERILNDISLYRDFVLYPDVRNPFTKFVTTSSKRAAWTRS